MLAKLKALTRSSSFERPDDVALQLRALEERLERWPADVVRKVLNEWPDGSPFFPAWHDLLGRLDRLTRRRAALLRFLEAELDRSE